jgi:hypothetical protein
MVMKKMMALALLLAGCALFAGEAFDIKGDFKAEKKGLPVGWIQNKGKWIMPLGEIKIVDGTDGQKAVELKSAEKATHLYTLTFFPAVAGDKVEISFKCKGEGKGKAGIYGYTAEKKWAKSEYKSFKPEAEWKEVKIVMTVKDKSEEKKVGQIRFVIIADKKSNIIFEDLKAQKL